MNKEEKQPEQKTQLINNPLTERVNTAYIANSYTLLNGGSDNVIMIGGEKDGKFADILLTLEGMEEVAQSLRDEADKKLAEKSDGQEE